MVKTSCRVFLAGALGIALGLGQSLLPGFIASAQTSTGTSVATPSPAQATTNLSAATSAPGVAGPLGATGATGNGSSASPSAVRASTSPTEAAAAAVKSADANAALLAQIARLPPLTGTDINVGKRSGDVRDYLNTVLRFYRAASVPIQKVGEPSDVLYAEQSQSEAIAIAELAFQAARNEAALLNRVPGAGAGSASGTPQPNPDAGNSGQSQAERIAALRTRAQGQLQALQAQQAALNQQIEHTRAAAQHAALAQHLEQVEGGIELQQAMVDALGRVGTFSVAQAQTGLAGDIDRLQRSAPELLSKPLKPPAPPVLQNLAEAHEAGVTTQASVLFQLLGTLHTIDGQIKAIDQLSQQASNLRQPFLKILRSTVQQGQELTDQSVNLQATPTTDAQDLANTRKRFDTLTNTFQVLANATLPLSQQAVLLENARGSLTTWRATVQAEYRDVLRDLLLRVLVIAIALGILALANRILNRAAVKYVADLRRRRQLLLVRRIVIGFLTGLVLIFGFVTQFSSLATFAGFISAGIAVGLQSILLSVAAYFFIVGRYGVRVGDRITVAGVTGEVIEVGLVRFYMMELVGTGTELHSTGRVAVFANSVLFQTGTPIYKQMPGTEYAWHELTAKLNSGADTNAASAAVLKVVQDVYAGYSGRIQEQHQRVETWMGTALPAPQIESRLQLSDTGLQYAVLFPVEITHAAEVDQQIAEALLTAMRSDGPAKSGLAELPVIKAAVKS